MSRGSIGVAIFSVVVVGCTPSPDEKSSSARATAPSASTAVVTRESAPPSASSAPAGLVAVSIVEVLARPELYDGRRVSVAGFLGSDESKLYLTREHAEHGLVRYAIAMNRADCRDHFRPYPAALDDLKDSYVNVEAVVSTHMGGEFGESPAGLCDIVKIERVGKAE